MIQIYHADVMQYPATAWPAADLTIMDPPFSPKVHENITSAGTLGSKSRGWHRQELEFEPLTPELRAYLAKVSLETRGWSLIFSDFEGSHEWIRDLNLTAEYYRRAVPCVVEADEGGAEIDTQGGYSNGLPYVRWSQAQKSGDRPTQGFEMVLHSWAPNQAAGAPDKPKMRWFGPGSLTHYRCKAMRGAEKHRTQKPLKLLLQQVSWYSQPGQTVRDLTCGAGTTIQAARILGRNAYGAEKLEKWANYSFARVNRATLEDVDLRDVRLFCTEQEAEARALLAKKPKADGSDKKTRARAEHRLRDVDIAREWIK